ncbi:tail fiber protein [Synechococcus phage ACG-2014h]|uniref:Tail fiber-like protein n=1 Tax=Synechococcus phage ACG-2014h TaxID=1340810 RepID=V5UTB4_9CAUD|nr:tail fiber protein [Synechococcus phage ACG-2014h]AHB80590.1 hypothetical protein S-MbCM7_176 [Synechococcus phage ACG-2014h]
MSKILANQIANYLDNAPIEIKEGFNIPTGKPLQVNGSIGTNGQVLSTDGTGLVWATAPYFDGNYLSLSNLPTIPAAQVNSDWGSNSGVSQILNKPIVPPVPSVTIASSPSGNGSLTYNSTNGEFTLTQADLSSYLTVETDPVFAASDAAAVTTAKITNWDSAYSWGNHATQNYITLTNISAATAAASGAGTLTYNNSTGVFTLAPPDLSSYLTAESDTLATVAARGATTTADVTVNDMTVNGNLTVVGTTTSTAQSTLNVAATEIVINDGQTGAPALNGSLKIDRGSGTDTAIRWNEGTDIWEFSNDGTTYNPIPTNNNQLTNGAGYLTSYTETDPVFSASPAGTVTNTNITNWNTAYGWGDHSTQGYLTAEADTLDTITARGSTTNNGITVGGITVNGNMTVNGTQTVINTTTLKVSDNEITLNNDVTGTPTENAGIEVERGLSANTRIRWDETSDRWQFTNNGSNYVNLAVNISDLPNDSGFISSYTETDPVFSASAASGITTQNLTNWNASYNWGDHSTQGYLTSLGDAAGVTTAKITDWDTAHGWGDHAQAGYLTSFTEADTLDSVTGRGATTTNDITLTGATLDLSGSTSNLYIGASSNRIEMSHNTSNGNLTCTTGYQYIRAASGFRVQKEGDGFDDIIKAVADGAVELYYDDVKKFETTSTGVTISGDIALGSGDLTTTGKLFYSNNFATTGDLPSATTYHGMFAHVHGEGHGYFAHAGLWTQLLDTGSSLSELADVATTAPSSNDVLTWNGSGWAPAAAQGGGGGGGPSTDTLDDVTSRGATTSNDIFLGDSTKLGFGANGSRGDVEVYYDQANLRYTFEDVSGCEFRFENNVGGNATAFNFLKGGSTLARMSAVSVDLWAGGTQRLQTTSTGVTITGALTVTSIVKSGGTNTQFLKADGSVDSTSYLTSYTETDPVFSASEAANILSTDTTNWNTAYGWGNHAGQGYLTSVGGINTLTDVNLTTPLTNQTLVYNGSQWVNSYGASGLQSRTTAQGSTGTIADGSAGDVTIGASKSYLLMKVQTSAAAWVTLYTDTGSRSSDSSRLETTDPSPGSGVIAEVITSAASTQIITPGVMGWNDDGTPGTNVYAKVVNKSGASANITVTITYVALEI